MSIRDYKITDAQFSEKGVIAAPDTLTGTAAENKGVFDRFAREIIKPQFNAIVDKFADMEESANSWSAEEAQRVQQENARQSAEQGRADAEGQRETNETARLSAEKNRISAENDRVTAETARVNAENKRDSAEKSRVSAESGRVSAESARVTAESQRANAESSRAQNESARVSAETGRADAEADRVSAETARANAESTRQTNENARVSAEESRAEAETARQTADEARNVWEEYSAGKAYVPGNKVSFNGSSYVCTANTTGHAPTDTAYWLLIAQKGADGMGAGDMLASVYDPKGRAQDVFQYADAKASAAKSAAATYTDNQIKAIPTPDVSGQISAHNAAADARADKFAKYLPLAGGKMTGKLTGIQTPTVDDNPTPKSYVDGGLSSKAEADLSNVVFGLEFKASTLPSSDYWSAVAYGDGKFVAVAGGGSAAYSTDGITWTAATLPSSAFWHSVTYGDGKFVAIVDGSDVAAYSNDGITWTATTLPLSASWCSVTYGNGKFVTVATNSNMFAYSTDGITWTASTLPLPASWSSVTYGNGKFVAVADASDTAAYSTDGITWTAATLPADTLWRSVSYGNGKFVAVAEDAAAYSNDGITWTATTLPSSASWQSVTYGNDKFVAVASSSDVAAYSADGITWAVITLPSSAPWQSITCGDGKFVAVASRSTTAAYAYPPSDTVDRLVNAGLAKAPVAHKVTLSTSGWNSSTKQQTVNCADVAVDETAQLILPMPAAASLSAYNDAGILCTGQGAGTLTFQCETVPTAAIDVYVTITPVNFS